MFQFHKLWLFNLLFCALEARAEMQTAGRLDLSIEDLQQTSSLLLNENFWLLQPDVPDSSAKVPLFQKGTHPRHFIKDPEIMPGADSATFQLTVHLNQKAPLSLMVPKYPRLHYSSQSAVLLFCTHSDQPGPKGQPERGRSGPDSTASGFFLGMKSTRRSPLPCSRILNAGIA